MPGNQQLRTQEKNPPTSLSLITQDSRTDGVECTGQVEKHDPHSADGLVQIGLDMIEKVDYGVLSSEAAVRKLKGFQMWSDVGVGQG